MQKSLIIIFTLLIGCADNSPQKVIGEPLLTTSGNVFAKMFYDNPINADPYLKKIVAITGIIDRIEPQKDITLIFMRTETLPIMFGFPSKKGLGSAKRGKTETIKGIVEGYADGFVVFSNCQIVQ